jgi:hypothetical protein
MDILDKIDDLLKENKILECISLVREKTKCYNLLKILCEKAEKDNNIEKTPSFWNDYSIAHYYLGDKMNAYKCYDNIFPHSKTILNTESDIDFYSHNMSFSIPEYIVENPISLSSLLNMEIEYLKYNDNIKNNIKENYYPLNPSIIKVKSNNNDYIVNFRTVNYRFDENFKYITNGFCNTVNYIANINDNFDLLDIKELKYKKLFFCGNFDGWEDIRLFYYKNVLHCSATTLQATQDRKQKIILSNISENLPEHILLDNYGKNKIQKNWVPIVSNLTSKLYFIYSFFPLIILEYDENIKNVKINQVSKPKNFNKWRGGTPAVSLSELGLEYNKYYLCIVHESDFPKYKHKFVVMQEIEDGIFEIYKDTEFFYFIDETIEFCSGMVISHDKQNLILTFGKMDREVYFAKINISIILENLKLK